MFRQIRELRALLRLFLPRLRPHLPKLLDGLRLLAP
jgi:hypothetical protein